MRSRPTIVRAASTPPPNAISAAEISSARRSGRDRWLRRRDPRRFGRDGRSRTPPSSLSRLGLRFLERVATGSALELVQPAP
jgi:hypothetical protein